MTTHRKTENELIIEPDRRVEEPQLGSNLYKANGKRKTPHDYSSNLDIVYVKMEPQPKNVRYVGYSNDLDQYHFNTHEDDDNYWAIDNPFKEQDIIVALEDYWTEQCEGVTYFHIFDLPPKCKENLTHGYGMKKHSGITAPKEIVKKFKQWTVLKVLGVRRKWEGNWYFKTLCEVK